MLAVLALCALWSGCGGEGSEGVADTARTGSQVTPQAAEPSSPPGQTVAACLKDRGVDFAESRGEIAFLARAETRGDAYKQGAYHDDVADISVDTLGKGRVNGRPPEWYVWTGHPVPEPGEEIPTPFDVVDAPPPQGFVAYVIRPSPKQRKGIETCFKTRS